MKDTETTSKQTEYIKTFGEANNANAANETDGTEKSNKFKTATILLLLTLLCVGFTFAATPSENKVIAPAVETAAPEPVPVTVPADVTDPNLMVAVKAMMQAEAITGDTDGLFHPETNLTRAQVCKMLVTLIDPSINDNLASATQFPYTSSFTDLNGAVWARPHIDYAAANGIAKGYSSEYFGPSNNVTIAELSTFVVRACGYSDASLGGIWPENYLKMASNLHVYNNLSLNIASDLAQTTLATKAQAAMMLYNAMDRIQSAHPHETDWSLSNYVASIPNKSFTYVQSGNFDENLTQFSGIPLSSDIKLIRYSKKSQYSESLSFSNDVSDYEEATLYGMKGVSTSAFYTVSGGKIMSIILPFDVGFSGRIYGVVNGTDTFTGKSGNGIEFEILAAMKPLCWISTEKLSETDIIASMQRLEEEQGGGVLFELTSSRGKITQVAVSGGIDPNEYPGISLKKAKVFGELSFTAGAGSQPSKYGWVEVTEVDFDRNMIKTSDWIYLTENSATYGYSVRDNSYSIGKRSDIKVGSQIRMYDISDNDDTSADIVIVKQN